MPLPPDVSEDLGAYDAWARDREARRSASLRGVRARQALGLIMVMASAPPACVSRTLRSLHGQTSRRGG